MIEIITKTLRELTDDLRRKGFSEIEAKAFIFDTINWWHKGGGEKNE